MFPTADQIAIAVVTAAKVLGEDPEAVVHGAPGLRARHVAMDALAAAFPEARRTGLARCLGYKAPRAAQEAVVGARNSRWWNEMVADEIVGLLVADAYGEQAA